jgi:hypothetical protein
VPRTHGDPPLPWDVPHEVYGTSSARSGLTGAIGPWMPVCRVALGSCGLVWRIIYPFSLRPKHISPAVPQRQRIPLLSLWRLRHPHRAIRVDTHVQSHYTGAKAPWRWQSLLLSRHTPADVREPVASRSRIRCRLPGRNPSQGAVICRAYNSRMAIGGEREERHALAD